MEAPRLFETSADDPVMKALRDFDTLMSDRLWRCRVTDFDMNSALILGGYEALRRQMYDLALRTNNADLYRAASPEGLSEADAAHEV